MDGLEPNTLWRILDYIYAVALIAVGWLIRKIFFLETVVQTAATERAVIKEQLRSSEQERMRDALLRDKQRSEILSAIQKTMDIERENHIAVMSRLDTIVKNGS